MISRGWRTPLVVLLGGTAMTLHVARQGRKGRHLVACRTGVTADPPTIDVLRILHDSMELSRHIEGAG